MIQKCILVFKLWKLNPKNNGNQWVIPAIIVNTAPIDKT